MVFACRFGLTGTVNRSVFMGDDQQELERLILFLRQQHNLRKRSLVMADREHGGFLFFLYQSCDPRWITSFLNEEGT